MVALLKRAFALPYFLFFYVKTFVWASPSYRRTCFNGSKKRFLNLARL